MESIWEIYISTIDPTHMLLLAYFIICLFVIGYRNRLEDDTSEFGQSIYFFLLGIAATWGFQLMLHQEWWSLFYLTVIVVFIFVCAAIANKGKQKNMKEREDKLIQALKRIREEIKNNGLSSEANTERIITEVHKYGEQHTITEQKQQPQVKENMEG